MKPWVLLGIVLLLLPMVYAAKSIDVVLKPGESFFVDGKNITLLDSVNKSTMLCINNEKFIVSRDKRISGIYFDFRKATYDQAFFRIRFDCLNDCQCEGEECSNNACFFEPEELEESVNGSLSGDEESFFECSKDLDCNDNEICTIDTCKDSSCKHEAILGCSVPLDTQQDTLTDNKTFEYLAFTLLGVVLFLGAFAVFKLSMKKKK